MGGNEKGLSKGNKFRKYILGSVRMIFVTVGTHEQPFNRLIKAIDRMKAGNVFNDDVIIQTGYSTYEPKFCEWQKLYPYDKMLELVNQARIVITHGGPSSFIMPLQIGKIPILFPDKNSMESMSMTIRWNFVEQSSRGSGILLWRRMTSNLNWQL